MSIFLKFWLAKMSKPWLYKNVGSLMAFSIELMIYKYYAALSSGSRNGRPKLSNIVIESEIS